MNKKFAFLPKKVTTWRNTKAIIWLQWYCVKTDSPFFCLSSGDNDSPYINKLGFFSIEL